MPEVRLDAVSRRFGRVQALEEVSFNASPGEVVGLLGPNGAGKTTTMRLITGYLRPDAGRVSVGELDVATEPVAARRLIGYMPEGAPVPRELTVRSYLTYCTRLRNVRRGERRTAVDDAVDRAGLGDVAGQTIGRLSKGYRQRVALAQALVHDPPVLVLDEPTAGLDPRQVVDTRALIAKLGKRRTVLFSSHLLSEVGALCRRVVVIDRGRVVATRDVSELTGGRVWEVKVTGDISAAAAVVRALPGVALCTVKGDRLVVQGSSAELSEQLSTAIVTGGFGLVELRATGETLEDAYLRIVRE